MATARMMMVVMMMMLTLMSMMTTVTMSRLKTMTVVDGDDDRMKVVMVVRIPWRRC